MIRALVMMLLLAGCSNGARIGSGDVADALTTIEVINNPAYVEIGTAPDHLGGVGGAVVLLAQKYAVKVVLIEAGVEPSLANRSVDTIGWYWACQNLALFAGVEPASRVIIGGLCAMVYWNSE